MLDFGKLLIETRFFLMFLKNKSQSHFIINAIGKLSEAILSHNLSDKCP